MPEEKRERVLRARLLSPLWTGGVDERNVHIRETGLIGSLRFWYEGYCRWVGPGACHERKEGCACETCSLFGKTALARRFSLLVEGLEPLNAKAMDSRKEWQDRAYEPKLWAKTSAGAFVPTCADGTFEFRLMARAGEPESTLETVAGLLRLIAKVGGLGAKTQHGFGQFQLSDEVTSLAAARMEPDEANQGFTLAPDRFRCYAWEVPDGLGLASYEIRQRLRAGLRDRLGVKARWILGPVRITRREGPWTSRLHITNLLPDSASEGKHRLKIWFDDKNPPALEAMLSEGVGALGVTGAPERILP
jgi:CRISPR type III-B/RAMP module RAMP protein Cmr1